MSQWWYTSNNCPYRANDDKPANWYLDSWWICRMVCNVTSGAKESQFLGYHEFCWHHSLCRSWSVFQTSDWCIIHLAQRGWNSGHIFSMRWGSSLYGAFRWVHNVDKAYARRNDAALLCIWTSLHRHLKLTAGLIHTKWKSLFIVEDAESSHNWVPALVPMIVTGLILQTAVVVIIEGRHHIPMQLLNDVSYHCKSLSALELLISSL
jgi:hypothetical protein